LRLVFVEWLDSYGCSSEWQQLDGCAPKPMVCKSVDWLLHDDETIKVLVPHVSTPLQGVSAQGCGDMTIPLRSVVLIVDLAEPIAA
jgi:hypothetical protein